MGLLYLFPTDDSDPDHAISTNSKLTLRSYGLPSIFWLYALGIMGILFVLYISIHGPLQKYLSLGEPVDLFLGYSLIGLFIACPLILLGFLFYEKVISIDSQSLTLTHKLFFLPIYSKKIPLAPTAQWGINHFIDSPNIAKIKDDRALKAFYNRGYYELHLFLEGDKKIFVDRQSQKKSLEKIKQMLERSFQGQ
ncbi:MAG: hypothetical protein H6621_00870 [Halobacteriovoraceae bacterium]|nr:hypothetical protein [Halobacteriovoraceae bacterium]MCB9093593.1 hypothetical protein [Halobacteriovoraceae bacterium]